MVGVSKNNGPKSSILIGFSIIFTIHFGVPLFLETPIYIYISHYGSMGLDDLPTFCCEKWPQEQGEMAGVNIPSMDPLGIIYPGSH